MWSSASYFSVGDSVVSRTSGCFLREGNLLTAPVGAVAAMAKSEEVISLILNTFNGAYLGVCNQEALFGNNQSSPCR